MIQRETKHFLTSASVILAVATGYLVSSLGSDYSLIFIAMIAGIFTTAIGFFSPGAGFYVLLISSMFGRYAVHFGDVTLRPDQFVLFPVVLGLVLRELPRVLNRVEAGRPSRRAFIPELVFIGFTLYIGVNALSSFLFAPWPAESFRIVIWLLFSFIAFAAAYFVVGRYVGVREAFFAVLAAGFVSAAVGTVLYLLFLIAGIQIGVQLDPNPKAAGTFYEANIFGSFQAFTSLAGLYVLNSGRVRGWIFGLVLSGTLVSIIALALSFTRAAWLGFLVGIIILSLFQLQGGRFLLLVSLIGALGFMVTLALAPTGLLTSLTERITSIGNSTDYNIAFRIDLFRVALTEWPSSPILGFGTNSFGQRYFDPNNGFAPAYLPSLFLVTLYDAGVIGLLILFSTLGLIVGVLIVVLRKGRGSWSRTLALALLAGLISLLVSYQGTNAFWFSYNWIILAIALRIYSIYPMVTNASNSGNTKSVRTGYIPAHRMLRPERS